MRRSNQHQSPIASSPLTFSFHLSAQPINQHFPAIHWHLFANSKIGNELRRTSPAERHRPDPLRIKPFEKNFAVRTARDS